MRTLILSAEAAAAATTRQPCETCGGKGYVVERHDYASETLGCPDCLGGSEPPPMLLRFVPVDDTRTPYGPCSRCDGHGMVDGMDGPRDCPECRGDCNVRARDASGRFTTVPVDTYTEGERIQIVTLCVDEGHPDGYECPPDCDGQPVAATATVARVLSIVDRLSPPGEACRPGSICVRTDGATGPWLHPNEGPLIDLSDHLPFVEFTPGGNAVELTDVVPS